MQEQKFTMSQAQYDKIIKAIDEARSTPLVALNAGMPKSPQEAANDAWIALGEEMGFDGKVVRPGSHALEFYATPVR